MDVSKLDQARAYLQINSGFNMMQACCALSMLLVFWCMNGFSLIDEWARTLPIGNVTVGLVFLSVMFAGQSLLALPFSIYDTFVIEKRFGFNRATPAALRVWLDYSHPPLSERLRALVKCMPS
jgi:STE24 endopeptidase